MKYTKYHVHILGSLFLVLASVMTYQFGMKPFLDPGDERTRLEDQASTLSRLHPKLVREHSQLIEQINQLRSDSTANKKLDQPLLEMISSMLLDSQITLNNFRQFNTTRKASDVELRLEGPFATLMQFVHDLDTKTIRNKIMQFDLQAKSSEGTVFVLRMQVHFTFDSSDNLLAQK